jgi:hypothetical protein
LNSNVKEIFSAYLPYLPAPMVRLFLRTNGNRYFLQFDKNPDFFFDGQAGLPPMELLYPVKYPGDGIVVGRLRKG